MADLSLIYSLCAPELPGVSIPMLDSYIMQAWRELARRSQCWSEWQSVALIDGQSAYVLTVPDGSRAYVVLGAVYGGRPLFPISPEALADADPDFMDRAGSPSNFWLAQDGRLVIYPTPTANESAPLKVEVSLVPTLSSQALPEIFAEKYGEVIAAGAKARLMVMPNQAWSNPPLSQFHQAQFDNGATEASIERSKGGTTAATFVRSRAFG